MPAGYCRHRVGKTLINVFHCYSAEVRFVSKLVTNAHIFINQRIECYLNNTINLRPLTTHMLYPQNGDRIVAIDSVTSVMTSAPLKLRPYGAIDTTYISVYFYCLLLFHPMYN